MRNSIFLLNTAVEIAPPKWTIDYSTSAMFIGSCFSDNIGELLCRYKFPVMLNPFGVLYNPFSISRALKLSLAHQRIKIDDLVFHDELWHSFDFHGTFSSTNSERVIEQCNKAIDQAHEFLKNANVLFITFGTAWVYTFRNSGSVVANCHKIPANQFNRYRLTISDVVNEWSELIDQIKAFNPDVKIVFTVSPVRHLKDGAHGNQLSKSVLLLAIDEIISKKSNEDIVYFPAYELINDELRDYRFYNSDMVHISETAIHYIFEKVKTTFFSPKTFEILKQVEGIVHASEHRVLHNNQKTLTQFSHSMLKKIETLNQAYPYINFEKEVEHFKGLEDLQ